jgi:hypothetical protein
LDNKLKKYLIEFPSRKIFGITSENPDSVEKRRQKLESYLNHAF